MADIRCQMCGKPNPADAEICQFCQARLKPVWASKSAESFFEAEPESGGEEVPDWLRSLRGPEEPVSDQPTEEPSEAGLFSSAESSELAGGSEWLSGIEDTEKIEPSAIGGVFDLEAGDDFSELVLGLPQVEPEQVDWQAETAGIVDESGVFPVEPSPEAAPMDEEGQPDWLERVKARQKSDEEQQKGFSFEPESSPPSAEIPDWLTRMTLSETEIPEDSQTFPEWMKEDGSSAIEFASEDTGTGAEGTPSDWLSDVLGPEDGAVPAFEDEFSAFMSDGSGTAKAVEPEAEEPGAGDSGLDWITGVYQEPSAGEPAPTDAGDEDSVPNQDGYPDWLSALGVSSEQMTPQSGGNASAFVSPESLSRAEELASVGETPDWLAGLGSDLPGASESAEEKHAESISDFASPDELSASGLEEAMPDWLANLDLGGTPTSTGGPSPFLLDEPLEAEPSAEYPASTPDWLLQAGVDTAGTEEAQPDQQELEQEPGLAPAELPNWLEAMRPIETGSAEPFKDITDDRVESAGPLSGLRGALPVGALPIRRGKPSISALKIQVPDAQQNRAAVLQKLLEDESSATPLPAPALAVTPVLLRLIVFGVFVLASFFAIWVGGKQVPLPSMDLMPQGALDFRAGVDLLPAGAPVLLAVDYEPGFTGELDGAATAVLNHLAGKGSLITFVSTNYNGTALAQRLLASVNRQEPFLQNPFTNYRNMGYIPGGAAGLAAFAKSPDVVLPYDLEDNFLWSSSPFDSTKGLSNFSMVIVITHDADTARAWIEQVGPALGEIPMQMVISAQAEPLVLPYYAGLPRQISGLVTGLAGGVVYETLQGRSGAASRSWDAYSISLTLAVVFILVGGLMGIGSVTLSQYKQSKAEGEA
jgi:hypothetical protein